MLVQCDYCDGRCHRVADGKNSSWICRRYENSQIQMLSDNLNVIKKIVNGGGKQIELQLSEQSSRK